jgi:acyl-CoA dehydrogenase
VTAGGWRSRLEATALPPSADRLRSEVRSFLAAELAAGAFVPRCDNWLSGIDPAFSRKLATRGWVGMTFPSRYGGHDRTSLERFVVTEELLVAGAPVAAHWFSDRQIGPSLLRHGSDAQKHRYLPAIARGELYFALGMSEPDAGSDLAAVRTRAEPVAGGWLVTGSKVWTSSAHVAHAILALVRTSPSDGDRHEGLSQLVVDLPNDGVDVRPIRSLDGGHHFNEVVFERALVPEDAVLGRIGDGWRQVTSELAYERSGPERLLSTLPLLARRAEQLRGTPTGNATGESEAMGLLIARLWVLRQLSLGVAGALAAGDSVEVEAALVKDLGTRFERHVVETVRSDAGIEPDPTSADPFTRLLADAVVHSPGFSLRGGTNEILRGVVARSMGAR